MLLRETTSVYFEGRIINIQLQCVWQNGEFRNGAVIGIYLAPGFQWLTNQQQLFLYALLHFSDCQRVHNSRRCPTRKMLPLITAAQMKQKVYNM